METALTVVKPDVEAYEPRDIPQALRVAEVLVKSRLLPAKVATAEQAFVIMATGKELGLTAMQSLRSIHVIDGKPSCSADLILALCKREPRVCKYFRLVKSDGTVATYETHREGEPGPTTLSFTIAEAQQAKLTSKDVWQKYPAAMLRARCIAALARAVYPDLVLGVYETDELEREPRIRGSTAAEGAVYEGPGKSTAAELPPHDPITGEIQEVDRVRLPDGGGAPEGRGVPGQAGSLPVAASSDPCAEFKAQIAAAQSIAALEAIRQAISAAHKAKALTDEIKKSLIEPWTARRNALTKTTEASVGAAGGPADNSAAGAHNATAPGTSDPSVTEQAGEPRAATGLPAVAA